MDGKNVADFIDPDIAEKLEALEREEERLQEEGFYDSEEDMVQQPSSPLNSPASLTFLYLV
jgi:nucleolar GTP-binding protein